ncbi:hypothetical protein Q9L42_020545 (plasmid) [Methylomarinum sp. Ch1-1]|uniref:Uncharacterized protein n=1 Tax=Methylomarinum roseum TaxID=3067653 RepID=A0AAU7P0B8_9GAMM|nr:hypothetical protein [Methylomarinum sp. Ch1-1]MDP4523308.1 hypothetical protein [Methylomarinum sp. Ch1-1]
MHTKIKENTPSEDTKPQTASEEQKQFEAKAILARIVSELGGTISSWERSAAVVGLWDYADITLNDKTERVGVSGGGVVSINGKPHDPEGNVNDSETSVGASIAAAFPAPETDLDMHIVR